MQRFNLVISLQTSVNICHLGWSCWGRCLTLIHGSVVLAQSFASASRCEVMNHKYLRLQLCGPDLLSAARFYLWDTTCSEPGPNQQMRRCSPSQITVSACLPLSSLLWLVCHELVWFVLLRPSLQQFLTSRQKGFSEVCHQQTSIQSIRQFNPRAKEMKAMMVTKRNSVLPLLRPNGHID